MTNKLFNLLAIAGMIGTGNELFDYVKEEDLKYCMNPDVNECQLNLYMYLMSSQLGESEQERLLAKFGASFEKLDDMQREYVKRDYENIIKTQDKNIRRERND